MKKNYLILLISSIFATDYWNGITSTTPTPYQKEIIDYKDGNTTVKFKMDGFYKIPVDNNGETEYIVKTINGASLLETGNPDLQKYSASLVIPDNLEMNVRVDGVDYIDFENVNIAPSKGNISRLINPNSIQYSRNDIYTSDEFFPGKLADLNDPYILRDLRGQAVNVYPFQYNPESKTLRVYTEITVTVFSVGQSNTNIINRSQAISSIDKDFNNVYSTHFENYEHTQTRFEYLDEIGNLLIISYGGFIDAMQPLVDWKRKKGIPTEIVDVASIGSNSTAIETYVDDYYHNQGLTFLLLVGDIAQIPSPEISGAKSDPSYGFIDGNDYYSEIIVGRFSANTPSDVTTQVERTINYERFPSDGVWYNAAGSFGSNQGPGWGGLTDDQFLETAIWPLLDDYTYGQHTSIYDPNSSVSDGVEAINNGLSIINYTGHGYQDGWGNGAPLSSSDVNGLVNTDKLPFVITVGCNVGEFDYSTTVFTEAWLKANHDGEPTGAIGHIGSTISQSWEPPMHGQYGMNLILTEVYDDGISHTLGGIATNGCMYMNDMQGSNGINETKYWTYFGDPSVVFRTNSPSNLSLSYNAAIVIGQSELVISTDNNNSVAALSQNNELLSVGYSNNGQIELDLSTIDLIPGEYDLVVTGYNAFPYESNVTVISPEGPYLVHDNVILVEEGLGNGQIDFGENLDLILNAENVGVEGISNVNATITSNDPYVSINDSNISFSYIDAGSIVQSDGSINISIAGSVPDLHVIPFTILYWAENYSWESSFNIIAHAPVFEIANPVVFDENQDGIWDAGESATIILDLINSGSSDFNYPNAYIESSSDFIEVITEDNVNTFYVIFADAVYQGEFQLNSNIDTPEGTTIPLTVYFGHSDINPCLENSGYNCVDSAEFTFDVTIGLPFSDDADLPENLILTDNIDNITLTWDVPEQCPDGQFDDCDGQCIDDWYEAWIGDGVCDDGGFGVDFLCEEFGFDGGDCGDFGDDGGDTGGGDSFCGDGYCDILNGEDENNCPEDCFIGSDDSCSGFCGSSAGSCWCDSSCADLGDCCADFCDYCSDTNSNYCDDSSNRSFDKQLTLHYDRTHDSDGYRLPFVMNNRENREIPVGYNIYKNDLFLDFTPELSYIDSEIQPGMEYCYYLTAVYNEYQSLFTSTECIITEGEAFSAGDINYDGVIDILDIISLVNMILGINEDNLQSADMNFDGVLNVLDIISIVNIILDE